MGNGKLVISLDLEIYWGVRDVVKLKDYEANLIGVRQVIPRLLSIFNRYKINATFATVGFLFFNEKNKLLNSLPERKPQYRNTQLSPYGAHLELVGKNEQEDQLHFGLSLIEQIKEAGQEIGCHTFSHYYCLEDGQTLEDFKEDLLCAKNIAKKKEIQLKSFVFPRNQYNENYLNFCKEVGITSYRGNERSFLFSSKNKGRQTIARRPFRLMDAYINLSGHNCYSKEEMKKGNLINIPSSRFLRPYSKKISFLENYRLKRITNSMTYAAQHNLVYHLWWHPHNFGTNITENFSFLEKILMHYQKLNMEYAFGSMSMQQLSNELKKDNE